MVSACRTARSTSASVSSPCWSALRTAWAVGTPSVLSVVKLSTPAFSAAASASASVS